MFFRLISKFRAENVIRAHLADAFLRVLAWAAQHLTSELLQRFPAAFALKNWHKILAAAAAPPRLALRQNSQKSPRNLRAFGYSC